MLKQWVPANYAAIVPALELTVGQTLGTQTTPLGAYDTSKPPQALQDLASSPSQATEETSSDLGQKHRHTISLGLKALSVQESHIAVETPEPTGTLTQNPSLSSIFFNRIYPLSHNQYHIKSFLLQPSLNLSTAYLNLQRHSSSCSPHPCLPAR